MRELTVVHCGGTIMMTVDQNGIRQPASKNKIVELTRTIAGNKVRQQFVKEIDSADITPKHWTTILRTIRDVQNNESPIVVTHGTDTLAWTAGMLNAAHQWTVPVVLTGANIPAGERYSDAETNLQAAINVTEHLEPGVYVVFAGNVSTPSEVFQGGFVRKVRIGDVTFAGVPNRIAVQHNLCVVFENPLRAVNLTVEDDRFKNRVMLIQSNPTFNSETYKNVVLGPVAPDVVVIELYACGTTSHEVINFVAAATKRGVRTFACPPSPISETEAVYPSTSELVNVGAELHLDTTVELLVPYASGLKLHD